MRQKTSDGWVGWVGWVGVVGGELKQNGQKEGKGRIFWTHGRNIFDPPHHDRLVVIPSPHTRPLFTSCCQYKVETNSASPCSSHVHAKLGLYSLTHINIILGAASWSGTLGQTRSPPASWSVLRPTGRRSGPGPPSPPLGSSSLSPQGSRHEDQA